MKFDNFMKKHGYPSIYSLQKNKVNNPLIVRGQFDVGSASLCAGRGAIVWPRLPSNGDLPSNHTTGLEWLAVANQSLARFYGLIYSYIPKKKYFAIEKIPRTRYFRISGFYVNPRYFLYRKKYMFRATFLRRSLYLLVLTKKHVPGLQLEGHSCRIPVE